MSMDTSYVFSYAIYCIIEIIIFLFCYLIYKNTKGASVAYKMWAISTFLLLIGSSFLLINGILFEGSDSRQTNKNEVTEIIASTIHAFGYFYVPVGVLYLSKDMGIGKINEDLIKKSQIIFFSAISSVSISLMVIFPFFEIVSIIGITFNLLYVIIWIFSIISYYALYDALKTTNRCWLLIYIGMWGMFTSEVFNIIYFLIPEAAYLMILAQLVGSAGFIGGFFKLAKMVEAI